MSALARLRLAGGATALRALGLTALGRRRFGWFPTVLTYHGVHDGSLPDDLYAYNTKHVHVDDFERQLRWLTHHYDIVPLAEVQAVIASGQWRPRLLALTFDDGYENNYRVAWPVLRRMSLPATIFVTTDIIDRQRPYDHDRVELALRCADRADVCLSDAGTLQVIPLRTPADRSRAVYAVKAWLAKLPGAAADRLRGQIFEQLWSDGLLAENRVAYQPMSWDQVRELADAGVEIGSHTVSHPHLARLEPGDIARELSDSRARLESRIGRPVVRVSYPFGSHDARVMAAARSAGYESAYITHTWYAQSPREPFAIPRISVAGGAPFALFVAATTRALQLIGRGEAGAREN
ncbi:MAG: polysaccharide deacetylase family protein [Phycisphaerae bacterium]